MGQSPAPLNILIVDESILVNLFENEQRQIQLKLDLYRAMDVELLLIENMQEMLATIL
jgi:hypothetical protein